MEKLITKITDNDFGLKFCDMEKPQLRKGARGIVIREDGKIAIFIKQINTNINCQEVALKKMKIQKILFIVKLQKKRDAKLR